MHLTRSNLVYYLLDKGLVSSESLVHGDFLAVEVPRRNQNFKVLRKTAPSYFVKQLRDFDSSSIAMLDRQAACHSLAGRHAAFEPLRPLIPRLYMQDSARHVLVTELVSGGEDLLTYHMRLGGFPVETAQELACALACCARVRAECVTPSEGEAFPRATPWILSVYSTALSLLRTLTGGSSQLFAIIRQFPHFSAQLDALRANWQIEALMHGDVRWENCIVSRNNSKMDLKLVDWELADFGDPLWDVGAALQCYLTFWIQSMPFGMQQSPSCMVELARYPLEDMQPAIRAFWRTYVEILGVTGGAAKDMLERSVSYCGARMIQSAYEQLQGAPQITPIALFLLQTSLNILDDPRRAITDLLEI